MNGYLDWLWRHIHSHPTRLLVTVAVLLVASWTLAGYAVLTAIDANTARNEANQRAAIFNCVQINELRRELYVELADIGVPLPTLLPTTNCERLHR